MNELYIMGGALIAAGLYISYQYMIIAKYKRYLALATVAMEAAYIEIIGGRNEEADTE